MVIFFRNRAGTGGGNYSSWRGNHVVVWARFTGDNGLNLQHEMGHYLGLDHVFAQAFDSVPAASTFMGARGLAAFDGDGLADTPPSIGPALFQISGDRCNLPKWIVIPYASPLQGAEDVEPDKLNIMDYFACGPGRISPMQAQRIRLRLHDAIRAPLFSRISSVSPQPIFNWLGMCLDQRTQGGLTIPVVEQCAAPASARATQSWQFTASRQIRSGASCLEAVGSGDVAGFRMAPCSAVVPQSFTRWPDGNLTSDLDVGCVATVNMFPGVNEGLVRTPCVNQVQHKWWSWGVNQGVPPPD
jgi:Pregnancy-associated plasma protein-A./Ricin-type beta-trefoil lectin domain.